MHSGSTLTAKEFVRIEYSAGFGVQISDSTAFILHTHGHIQHEVHDKGETVIRDSGCKQDALVNLHVLPVADVLRQRERNRAWPKRFVQSIWFEPVKGVRRVQSLYRGGGEVKDHRTGDD